MLCPIDALRQNGRRLMRKSILPLIAILLLTGGCLGGGDKGSFQGVNSNTAKDMNAARSAFERAEDPPMKPETHFAAGQLNETQGQPAVAAQQYEAALKIN